MATNIKSTSEPLTIVDELWVVEVVKSGSMVVVQEKEVVAILNAP
jgi:hypothetical protein